MRFEEGCGGGRNAGAVFRTAAVSALPLPRRQGVDAHGLHMLQHAARGRDAAGVQCDQAPAADSHIPKPSEHV